MYSPGGVTHLMVCAEFDSLQVMSYLLAHGAIVNAQDEKAKNAIQVAHLFGRSKCVELLLDIGAVESSLQGLEFGSKREVCRIYYMLVGIKNSLNFIYYRYCYYYYYYYYS